MYHQRSCYLDFWLTIRQYYLDFKTKGTEIKKEDLFSEDKELWTSKELPQIPGMVPWLIFLYGGKFKLEDEVEIKESLEVYDCPAECSRICLFKKSRVLVIYKEFQ
jgi:hypothetical protein